ncbi:dTDP-4-dehydrorhamnose reductase [Entomospira nematocerorum]|uniref:dTDP-4-dehydrorhamnose reductase n=1 Tax=Entomospira nematocerorum TaxID=2719987 RepID=A0A968GC95_9SPIO|nr:dTDP-4-dehydrorhamnose reductase [Entomospira nematocera]NIZ47144.1 dTDP-4-dehydrorhamnose reductase [Entomospira nematocera]WDI34313.1 dTDP-4-dehydrorhamnose reductase [Entomospira nematocera]
MIWITGSNGMLATILQQYLITQQMSFIATSHTECDISDFAKVEAFYAEHKPTIIMNCAAFTDVDKANQQQLQALLNNTVAVRNLSLIAKPMRTRIVHFSSDYVFNGYTKKAYCEEDTPSPINFYGYTKKLSEAIIKPYPNMVIIRLSWLYSLDKGFPSILLSKARTSSCLHVVQDEIGTPTFLPKIIEPIIRLASSDYHGIYHCASEGHVSRLEFATTLFQFAEKHRIVNTPPIVKSLTAQNYRDIHPTAVPRPTFSALQSAKIKDTLHISTLGTWQEHLESFILEYYTHQHP